MTQEQRDRIRSFNHLNQLDNAVQMHNLNLAFESYARARQARDEYQRLNHLHYALDDRFVNDRQRAELAREMARLERRGLWNPDNPSNLPWFDDNTTLQIRIQVEQQGVIVRCSVEWSTGSIWDPPLMINVTLERDSPTCFHSHVPANPDVERHYSVVHMGVCERSVPDWGYRTAAIFSKIHGRRCWLVTEQPFWTNTDTGSYLDRIWDPIASDPDYQILNAAYKVGQEGRDYGVSNRVRIRLEQI